MFRLSLFPFFRFRISASNLGLVFGLLFPLAPTYAEQVPLAPNASFSANVAAVQLPLTVAFINTSTGSITSRSWEFGDGSASPAEHPTHTYTAPGTYTVRLLVVGPRGADTKITPITVGQPSYEPPSRASAQTAPLSQRTYGNPWAADYLSNLVVMTNKAGIRFQVEKTGTFDKIKFFFVGHDLTQAPYCGTWEACYGRGTGGTIKVELQTDDGTSNHFPSGTVLSTFNIVNPRTNPVYTNPGPPNYGTGDGESSWSLIDMPNASLTAGTIYHLVFTNMIPTRPLILYRSTISDRTCPLQNSLKFPRQISHHLIILGHGSSGRLKPPPMKSGILMDLPKDKIILKLAPVLQNPSTATTRSVNALP
jgi:PKD repeat protein